MNTIGIIAEYNPFHNGHAYQIAHAKKITGADTVVVVMSGNYVQRGVPAILDKFVRTKAALSCGADLVLELPVLWSVSSAEYFASAGIALLDRLRIIDAISFGCEAKATTYLGPLADFLLHEPEEYKMLIGSHLKKGCNFPAARERAILDYFQESKELQAAFLELLSSPNNILAIEYTKALKKRRSGIPVVPILRNDSGYHNSSLEHTFSSATAIRKSLHASECNISFSVQRAVPEKVSSILKKNQTHFFREDYISQMLLFKLRREAESGFSGYGDCTEELSNRIVHFLPQYAGFSSFCDLLVSRDMTKTRISRVLLHILLDLKNTDYQSAVALDYVPYARVLGFRKESAYLLKEITQKSSLPLISKCGVDSKQLSREANAMLEADIRCSNLYYTTEAYFSQTPFQHELQHSIILI